MELRLNEAALKDRAAWDEAGIRIYSFDREKVTEATKKNPTWVHFGCGNIYKAFHCVLAQKLLDEGKAETGIVGVDNEIVDLIHRPHDNLTLVVTLKADGTISKTVIGSMTESRKNDSKNPAEFGRLQEVFRAPSLQMCTFTITEKGYNLFKDGGYAPDVIKDLENGPVECSSYIGKVASLLYTRYTAGKLPIAMVSTDNCSHNGDKLRAAVCTFAEAWEANGTCEKGFAAYLNDPEKVSFPWSMIDKITPRPDDAVKTMLKECGFADVEGARTSRNTYVSPFVNAEEAQYLVIEDHFPNGHPALEEAGVIFTTRETVDKIERMKVCTCLNPLHTALAIFGCILGYTRICEEMKDEDLNKLVRLIGYREGMPAVTDPGIIRPEDFLRTCLEVRFPNPFVPDTPQRIATDTSQKLSVRFGQTIIRYLEKPELDIGNLKLIPLVLAGWCRYLMAIDDEGKSFELSPDPMAEPLLPLFVQVKLGEAVDAHAVLGDLLRRKDIFGLDLAEAGLSGLIEEYFTALCAGPGAVRKVLHEAVNA